MSPFDLSVMFFFTAILIKAAYECWNFWKEEDEIYGELADVRSRRQASVRGQKRAAVVCRRRKRAYVTPIKSPVRKKDKRAA